MKKEEHFDARYYEMANNEIENGQFDKALMTKALTKSKGDEKAANYLYIEWRVKTEIDNNPQLKKFKPILFWVFVVSYGTFAILLAADSHNDDQNIIAGLMLFNFFVIMLGGALFSITLNKDIKPIHKKYEQICMAASAYQFIPFSIMILVFPRDILIVCIINITLILCFFSTMLLYRKKRIAVQKYISDESKT